MLDLKEELETTGIKFKPLYWVKAPAYPYGIFDDVVLYRGDDEKLRIVEHDTTLELYAEKIDYESEKKIEDWIDSKDFEFKKTRIWIDSEKHYSTIYEFSFTEKKGVN